MVSRFVLFCQLNFISQVCSLCGENVVRAKSRESRRNLFTTLTRKVTSINCCKEQNKYICSRQFVPVLVPRRDLFRRRPRWENMSKATFPVNCKESFQSRLNFLKNDLFPYSDLKRQRGIWSVNEAWHPVISGSGRF